MSKKRNINLGKAAVYAIVINAIQIALVGAFVGYALWGPAKVPAVFKGVLGVMGLITCWGAVVDIREAISARQVEREADMLEEANRRMDSLNLTLRAQRHDFMNHLQVVYSLMEMQDYDEAASYIEKVYADIRRVSRTLKTAHPAINALLAAKLSDGERTGIAFRVEIESAWNDLPVESWAMCRVLGNLIDNGMDAVREAQRPEMTVWLGETVRDYRFRVSNNGAQIPDGAAQKIFQRGFSTKGEGRGMGLAIVREILEQAGGEISVASTPEETAFSGVIPKKPTPKTPCDTSVTGKKYN